MTTTQSDQRTTVRPDAGDGRRRATDRLTGASQELSWSAPTAAVARSVRRGRPRIHTRYASDQALLDTPAKRWWSAGALLGALVAPFAVPGDVAHLLATAMVYAIAGIGLNLLTGYSGQISLGHPFFMALGAYTAALTYILAFGLSKAATNFFAGTWADRYGRKPVLLAGWAVAIPIPAMLIWAPSWGWIVVALQRAALGVVLALLVGAILFGINALLLRLVRISSWRIPLISAGMATAIVSGVAIVGSVLFALTKPFM